MSSSLLMMNSQLGGKISPWGLASLLAPALSYWAWSPSPPGRGTGEHCKLPQWDRLLKGFLAFLRHQMASSRT